MARRGARSIGLPARPLVAGEAGQPSGPAADWQPEEWRRVDRPAARSGRARQRSDRSPDPIKGGSRTVVQDRPQRPRTKQVSKLAPEVAAEIARKVKGRGASGIERRMAQAAEAFEHDRINEAVRLLRPLASDHPDLVSVRELTGLALYRSGRWAEAARHLEATRSLTGSVEHHPVLADCYRALRRYALVDSLWKELREASPEPAILTEGRIVAAGALADKNDLAGAIRLLEPALGPRRPRKGGGTPIWDIRLWYALADLYERAGDTSRARELFTRVVAAEPDLADAAERLSVLT